MIAGMSEHIVSTSYDSTNGYLYIFGGSGSAAAYKPATGDIIDISAKINPNAQSSTYYWSVFDPTNAIIYTSKPGSYSGFISFNGGSNPTNGTYTDLSSKLGASCPTQYAYSSTFDSTNSFIYIGGSSGCFGVFSGGANPANGTWTDLTSKISADWSTNNVSSIAYDFANQKIYLGGSNARFGVFTGGADPANGTFVYLNSKISASWSTKIVSDLDFDSANGVIYLSGNDMRFGAYVGSSDPANGTFSSLAGKLSGWSATQSVYLVAYNSTNNIMYVGNGNGKFGALTVNSTPANGTWADITSKISTDWSTNYVAYGSFVSSTGTVYLAGPNGRFGSFVGGSDPANGTWTYLLSISAKFILSSISITTIATDTTNNIVYLGGGSGTLICYNPSTDTATSLVSKISTDWSTTAINALTFDSTNGYIYVGGSSGKFGAFLGGSNPASGTWTYLNSKITADWSTTSINSLAFESTNGYIYIGGGSGKFGAFLGGSNPASGTWTYLNSK
jgi:hypothetical protein